ncbi:MAG: dihydrodipicolinate synthase family protein [Actinomycetes bacterium]
MSNLHGLLTALVTPFTDDGKAVDEPALRAQVEHNIGTGVHGLVPGGSTGEFAAMTNAERRQVTEIVIDQTAGRIPVMAGVGAMTTQEAIGLAQHAESAGAVAIMVVAPYYEPLTVGETKDHFRAVSSSVGIDVMLYNLPGATGVNLEPAQLAGLADELPNVKYVKDTSGNFTQAAQLIHHHRDQLSIFVGWDTLYFAALVEGAAGSVNGAANFIAPELVAIHDLVKSGDTAAASEIWDGVFPIMEFLITGGYVTRVKGGLKLVGRSPGDPRRPMESLAGQDEERLRNWLKAIEAVPLGR